MVEPTKILNKALQLSEEELIARTTYKWRFIMASYKATVYNSEPLQLLEEVVCDILLNFGAKTFEELGAILGLAVENKPEAEVFKDNAEELLLNKTLKSLSEDYVMLQRVHEKYELTRWGKEFTEKGLKISSTPDKYFDVYFDSLSYRNELIAQYFKEDKKRFPAEESDWYFPTEDVLNDNLEIQAPQVFNSNTNKVAFYEDLAEISFSEFYAYVEVHALKTETGYELKVFWQDQYVEELTDILISDENEYQEVIESLSIELIHRGVIIPDIEMLESNKYRWNWNKLSENKLNFDAILLDSFLPFWDWSRLSINLNLPLTEEIIKKYDSKWNWEGLSSNPNLPLHDELLRRYEDKWNWEKLSTLPHFSTTLETIQKYTHRLNLNKAIHWLDEDKILSPAFYSVLEANHDRITPFTLQKLPWSIPIIDLFESFNKIKWCPRNWTEIVIRSGRIKMFEGSDDEIEVEVQHYEEGFLDNTYIYWEYNLLKKYWSKIRFDELDTKSKATFSANISQHCNWKSFEEILDFKDVIDWKAILLNPSVKIDKDFLLTFESLLDWQHLTKATDLTKDERLLETFKKKWDWTNISKDTVRKFTLPFLDKFVDYVDWRQLIQNPQFSISDEVLQYFHNNLDWELLSSSNRIAFSTRLLEEYEQYWNWDRLSINKSLSFDNIKLDRFKHRWNWGTLSKNPDINLDSFNLKEFNNYWHWDQITTPERIEKFLFKFQWDRLGPAEHKRLVLEFANQYNEKWVWAILKMKSYISLGDDVLDKFKSITVWNEIALDNRFPLSNRNLETYSSYLSWDSLSSNPRIAQPKTITRFKENWNWDILSSNPDLIHDINLLREHKEKWNWEIVSKSFRKFKESILLEFKVYWKIDCIDYSSIHFSDKILEAFENQWNWEELSAGAFFKFETDRIERFSERWNWELLSLNKAVSLNKNNLASFPENWILHPKRYSEIPFDEEILTLFESQLDWEELSEKSYIQFDVPLIKKFSHRWNWELLSQNEAISFNYGKLREFPDKWVISLINYNQIDFNENVLTLFVKNWDWLRLSSQANIKYTTSLINQFRELWDWEKLSSNPSLRFKAKHLREFSSFWHWDKLSERRDWDFFNRHMGLIEEFVDFWHWDKLLQWPELFIAGKKSFPHLLAQKTEEFAHILCPYLEDIDFSDNHDQHNIYTPSSTIEAVFQRKVIENIMCLPNTQYHEMILGREVALLREVIEYGRANFDEPFRDVTAAERVLIYCYLNMRKHFFTKIHILNMLNKSTFSNFFRDSLFKKDTTIIDVGCGPLTAGLAYADFVNSNFGTSKLTYYGIDISNQIIEKAKDFTDSPVFASGSTFSFFERWREVSLNLKEGQPILFIFSYLFANLNEELTDDLAGFTQEIIDKYQSTNPIFLMFQNPNEEGRNRMFYRFLDYVNITVLGEGKDEVRYRNKNYHNSRYEPSSEVVKYVIMSSNFTANKLIQHNLLNGVPSKELICN